ncbi:MAG: insulinase family protein [Spirochaetes bacterium]|nr:insulinase family protein [Spirochaetota bacterium]
MKHAVPVLFLAIASSVFMACPSMPSARRVGQTEADSAPAAGTAGTAQAVAGVPETVSVPKLLSSVAPGSYTSARLANLSETMFPNGVPLVVMKMPGSTTVCVRATFLADRESDPVLDALVLCSASIASSAFPDSVVRSTLHGASASLGWSLQPFSAALELKAPSKNLPALLGIFGNALAAPAFDAETFRRAGASVAARFGEAAGTPLGRARSAALSAAFGTGTTGRRHAILGDPRAVAAVILEAGPAGTRAYHAGRMTADRLVLTVAGDVDPVAVAAALSETVGKLPASGRAAVDASPDAVAFASATVSVPGDSSGLSCLYAAIQAPPADTVDSAVFELALSVLDDLLFDLVRSRSGLCYSIRVEYEPGSHAGIAVTGAPDPVAVRAAVGEAIDLLASGKALGSPGAPSSDSRYGPLAGVLEAYRSRLSTGYWEEGRSPASIAFALALREPEDRLRWFRRLDAIRAASAADVSRVVSEFVKGAPVVWCVASDSETAADP